MVLDGQTNKVFLAQGLRGYSEFVIGIIQALNAEGIDFAWLPRTERTEHIWARDYMPIQLEKDLFLQYEYRPDYLQGYPRYIPDYKKICRGLGLNYHAGRPSPIAWAFLNFLQVKDCIFVPWIPIIEHHEAQSQIQQAFPDYKIRFVAGAEELIREGGAVNCVTWNILADEHERPQEDA